MSEETELAWAAGFFDGEGSVYIRHTKRHKGGNGKDYPLLTVEISVTQVRPEPLERFKKLFDFGKLGGPYKSSQKNAKPHYRWNTAGRPSVLKVAEALWPYLSIPKKEQFEKCWTELQEKRTKKSPVLNPLPKVGMA